MRLKAVFGVFRKWGTHSTHPSTLIRLLISVIHNMMLSSTTKSMFFEVFKFIKPRKTHMCNEGFHSRRGFDSRNPVSFVGGFP